MATNLSEKTMFRILKAVLFSLKWDSCNRNHTKNIHNINPPKWAIPRPVTLKTKDAANLSSQNSSFCDGISCRTRRHVVLCLRTGNSFNQLTLGRGSSPQVQQTGHSECGVFSPCRPRVSGRYSQEPPSGLMLAPASSFIIAQLPSLTRDANLHLSRACWSKDGWLPVWSSSCVD